MDYKTAEKCDKYTEHLNFNNAHSKIEFIFKIAKELKIDELVGSFSKEEFDRPAFVQYGNCNFVRTRQELYFSMGEGNMEKLAATIQKLTMQLTGGYLKEHNGVPVIVLSTIRGVICGSTRGNDGEPLLIINSEIDFTDPQISVHKLYDFSDDGYKYKLKLNGTDCLLHEKKLYVCSDPTAYSYFVQEWPTFPIAK